MQKVADRYTLIVRCFKIHIAGGNFHLKVGGAKSSSNAGDPMLGFTVSGE